MDQESLAQFIKKLQQLERDLSCCLKSETECCGVSIAQCQSLLEIANKGEPSLNEIATALGLDNSTLSRMVNNLVNLGLVNRVLNPEDRRYVSLTLTEQGKSICKMIETSNINYIQKVFEHSPTEKQLQVVESVALLADAISRCNCDQGEF
jgi:DNA-binding MarR family transcriptional regulator